MENQLKLKLKVLMEFNLMNKLKNNQIHIISYYHLKKKKLKPNYKRKLKKNKQKQLSKKLQNPKKINFNKNYKKKKANQKKKKTKIYSKKNQV